MITTEHAVKWFFGTTVMQEALRTEIKTWRGTRFWEGTRGRATKGATADCVSFAYSVYLNLGAIDPIEWPDYVTHGGGPGMLATLCETLDSINRLHRIWCNGDEFTPLLPGDLLVVSNGKGRHHLAIYTGDHTAWHCIADGGVCPTNIENPAARDSIRRVYRPTL